MTIRNEGLHHNVDYTPYEGLEVQGWPVKVLSRGDVIVEDGLLRGQPGRGRFLEQATSSAWRPKEGGLSWT